MKMVTWVPLLTAMWFGVSWGVAFSNQPRVLDGSLGGESFNSSLEKIVPFGFSTTRIKRGTTTAPRTTGTLPLPIPKVYRPRLYEGFWYNAVWWLVETKTDARCMATFISERIAVTACECVVIVDKTVYTVAPYSHEGWLQWILEGDQKLKYENRNGQILKRKNPEDFHLDSIFYALLKNKRVEEIYVHDQCRSFFKYNFAMVSMEELPKNQERYLKAAWVHTPEDILFMSNMRRIISAQAILGNCKVPWTNENIIGITAAREETYEVNFLQWDLCRALVCPGWNRSFSDFDDWHTVIETLHPERINPYVKDVCVDSVSHTKWCAQVAVPPDQRLPSSCNFPPGTPVYCEVGRIQGIVGFFVSQTFACSSSDDEATKNIAVFQPLDIGINWIKNATGTRLDPNYPKSFDALYKDKYIPGWIWGLRKLSVPQIYNAETIEQKRPVEDPDVAEVISVFGRDQSDAVVNVYFVDESEFYFLCHGIQIFARKFVVPCWCVYRLKSEEYLSRLPWGEPDLLKDRPKRALQRRDPKKIQVRLAKNDNTQRDCASLTDAEYYSIVPEHRGSYIKTPYCQPAVDITKSFKCDSLLAADFALISTGTPLVYAKNVWIHTSNLAYFQRAWDFLPAASLVEGKCFYLRFEYFHYLDGDINRTSLHYTRTPIIFSPFDFCTPLLCDPEYNYSDDVVQEFCYNKLVELEDDIPAINAYNASRAQTANQARECITSTKANCGIRDGTPIFCDLDELRGLVGFVSRANMPGCFQKERNSKGKLPREVVNNTGANNAAIIMRFDKYLDEIKHETVIYWIEQSPEVRKRFSSTQATIPTPILLSAALMLVNFSR